MKTFVKHLLLMCLFIHSAEALQCMICTGYSICDQSSQNCSSEFCFSRLTGYQSYGFTNHYTEKGCALPHMCTSSGSHVVSYDYGFQGRLTNTTCCDTDNCNAAAPAYPVLPAADALQCYGCDPSKRACTANVTCNEEETCFHSSTSVYVGREPYFGCISKNVCNDSSLSPLYGSLNLTCCNTSHCNVPELGIQCMTCVDYQCSSQRSVTCSQSASMCYEDYSDSYSLDEKYTNVQKGCASPTKCTSVGTNLVSYDVGLLSKLIFTSCCDTDNCNINNTKVSPRAGSLQCYGCNMHNNFCTANVTCKEHETCFQSSQIDDNDQQVPFGCISENECRNGSPFLLNEFHNVSCCNTSHCNIPELGKPMCMACFDEMCSSERLVFCSKNAPMCYSRISGYNNYTGYFPQKGCAQSYTCPSTVENEIVSYHLGPFSYLMNITCCDTDGCNAANQTIMVSEGSLQCYSCYYNLSECTAVTCNELEVCAMSLRNATVQLYGCVSKNLCNSNFGQRYFGELSCCDTHLCNDPTKNTSLSPITLPPTNMTTEPPTNMTTEPPTNMTTEPPTNMTTEPPTTKTTEPPTTKTTEPPTTKTTEPPTTAENIIAHVKMQIMTSGSVSEEIILDFIKQFFKDQLIDLDPSVIIKKIV